MIKNGKPYVIEVDYKGRKLVGIVKFVKRTQAHQVVIHGVCNISLRQEDGGKWFIECGVRIIEDVVALIGREIEAQFEATYV